jgi:hypothetical protein
MAHSSLRLLPVVATALLLGACAGDTGGLFQTSSVTAPLVAAEAPKSRVSSECLSLAGQIDGLRKEGTIERLEKVSTGKGDNVQVKRTALAKQTELNKANADFQAKCGPRIPASTQAAAPTAPMATVASAATAAAPAPAIGKAAAKAAMTAKAAEATGVTVAPATLPKTQ